MTIAINPATPQQYNEIIKMLTEQNQDFHGEAPDLKEEFDAGQITLKNTNPDFIIFNLEQHFPDADWFDAD